MSVPYNVRTPQQNIIMNLQHTTKSIRVFAPATVANLGCGFDIMGMTLDGVGDTLTIAISDSNTTTLTIENRSGVELPARVEDNVITPALMAMVEERGITLNIHVVIEHKILPGSGIGSSSASSAAAVFGLNELLDRPFSTTDMIRFAMEGERLVSGGVAHADNAGPAVAGGIMLIRGYDPLDIINIPVPRSLYTAVVHPHITVSTRQSRAVMPHEISVRDAVTQWGNVGGLVAGLLTEDLALVGRSLRDVVAEPYRKHFIPGYDALKAEIAAAGALASNIAGSGPSVFALCDSSAVADGVGECMKNHFSALGIECDVYTGPISPVGARVIE